MRPQTRHPALAVLATLVLGLPGTAPAPAAPPMSPPRVPAAEIVPAGLTGLPAVEPSRDTPAVTRIRRAAADVEAAGERLVEERQSLAGPSGTAARAGTAWSAASRRYRDARARTAAWARRSYAVPLADRSAGGELTALGDAADRALRTATQGYAEAHLAAARQSTVVTRLSVAYAEAARALGTLRAAHRAELAAADARRDARDAVLSRQYLSGTALTGGTAAEAALSAVRYALAQLGKPYVWGAEGPHSFDCSGLVQTAYAAAGVTLPRTARPQYRATTGVPVSALLPGDLLFFGPDRTDWDSIHHVGIYLGGGRMVHAPTTGDVVRIAPVWWAEFFGATRVVGAVASPPRPAPGGSRPRVPVPSPIPSPVPPAQSPPVVLSVSPSPSSTRSPAASPSGTPRRSPSAGASPTCASPSASPSAAPSPSPSPSPGCAGPASAGPAPSPRPSPSA
jgi:cell wall-associated NlpC family hydrolase